MTQYYCQCGRLKRYLSDAICCRCQGKLDRKAEKTKPKY